MIRRHPRRILMASLAIPTLHLKPQVVGMCTLPPISSSLFRTRITRQFHGVSSLHRIGSVLGAAAVLEKQQLLQSSSSCCEFQVCACVHACACCVRLRFVRVPSAFGLQLCLRACYIGRCWLLQPILAGFVCFCLLFFQIHPGRCLMRLFVLLCVAGLLDAPTQI
jgi:hypothetical protein